MRITFLLALTLCIPMMLGLACNLNRLSTPDPDETSGDGGAPDGSGNFNGPCGDHPNSSTRCWLDGVKNGPTRNPTCPAGSQTALTGVVSIPAGTLPLANAKVYIAPTPAP